MNQVWSMGFMHTQLLVGRTFRVLNVIDDNNCKAFGMEIDFFMPSERVVRTLKQIVECRKPLVIPCDNGPENVSDAIQNGVEEASIAFQYIQPGKPQQNAYVERFNRTVSYKWLSQYYWVDLDAVRDCAIQWLWTYNHERLNMALGGIKKTAVGHRCLALLLAPAKNKGTTVVDS